MVNPLEEFFPGLANGDYQITSPANPDYDCIAWALGDSSNWWWPGPDVEREHWPPGIGREETLAAFQAMFASLGYEVCDTDTLEAGCEKLAIFADPQGRPTHAARQMAHARWTSKLGKREDIEHRLPDLEGEIYGRVVLVMRRLIPT